MIWKKKKSSGKYLDDRYPGMHPERVKEESSYYAVREKKQGEYTVEDYRKLPEDERVELIDGMICYLKLMKYQKAGVREYWLVDPDKKKVIVYDLEREEIPVIYGFTDQVPVQIFDGKCEIDFSIIYENIKFIYEQS